jgi:hypothetical protein
LWKGQAKGWGKGMNNRGLKLVFFLLVKSYLCL